jgi:L-malate glycosyltransferase
MKKVLFITPYPKGFAPSQRLKFEQYYSSFESANYKVYHDSFIDIEFWSIVYKNKFFLKKFIKTIHAYWNRFLLLFQIRNFDIIYIHLWYTPYGFPIFERIVTSIHKKVIYDIDDMVFLGHSSNANQSVMFLKGKNKMIFLMKKANHVITCTPHLDAFVRQFTYKTTDISSTINTDIYKPINSYSNDKTLTLGWSGSHSTSKYVYLIKDELLELSKKYKFKLLIIGDTSFNIPGLDFEAIEWDESTEIKNLQRIDIGLYPLPDEQWVLGKSGLKALQYMSLGIPTVATAIGANFRVIEDGISGLLVESSYQWKDAIEQYILNPKLRKKHGLNGRKRVEILYSVNANKSVYLKCFNNLINEKNSTL